MADPLAVLTNDPAEAAGMYSALARGIALGLGAAVPIGPVNVQIARRALSLGFTAGAMLGLGAVTADIIYAAMSSLSMTALLRSGSTARLIGAAGGALLAYLAWCCFRSAAKTWNVDPLANVSRGFKTIGRLRTAYPTGLLMTLLNPMTLAFWFTVVPASAPANAPANGAQLPGVYALADIPTKEGSRNLPILCAGVFIGTVAWVLFFSGLLATAGRFRKWWWLTAADGFGGATLLCFSAVAVWRALH